MILKPWKATVAVTVEAADEVRCDDATAGGCLGTAVGVADFAPAFFTAVIGLGLAVHLFMSIDRAPAAISRRTPGRGEAVAQ